MRKLLLILLATWVVSSCSRLPVLPAPDMASQQAWQQHDIRVAAITGWTARGRFSLQSPDDTWTGTLQWQQQGDSYHIQLSSPLGQGLIRLSGDSHGALLELGNGSQYPGDDAESLFKNTLGWYLPLVSLRHWILGRPQNDEPFSYILTHEGWITKLHQQNWVTLYKEYYREHSPPLPRRLMLAGGDLRIKLVIDQWTALAFRADAVENQGHDKE